MRTYKDGLAYLLNLTAKGIKPGLERVSEAFALLGHPERQSPSIIVGGTNGKGSVSTFVARALSKQGYRVGLFTSPHIHRLTERVRVDGREIGRRDLLTALNEVHAVCSGDTAPQLTFFEAMTVIAGLHFAKKAVDIAVLEVGLGGRLDATRVFDSEIVGITSIGLDHQQYLGDSLDSIAREKFALIHPDATVVVGELQDELTPILRERVEQTRASLWLARRDFDWQIDSSGRRMSYDGPYGQLSQLTLPLRGAHQAQNTAVAITLLAAARESGFDCENRALRAASRGFRWPARGEKLVGGRVILDVAHNPAGAKALTAQLAELVAGRSPVVLVFGCMGDKDVEGILRPLQSRVDTTILAAPRMPRALPVDQFPTWVEADRAPSVEDAVDLARSIAGEDGAVLITGSTFVVSEARAHLLGLKSVDPSIPM